ncbi:hypothetical protein HHK36_006895 [Tetracentron sinense]|uniref:F-box domain-containing protein n=1 Tax=Tetracentron sinense TaxID=13715 RepID=A0A834ZHZ9_TETSI|nr:hypothetical protein HHK36_006895 [Tetracentron sinense]
METPHRRSSDIISNLPDQVIETILAHLPIRDAVKTSLLSNKWRYKWNFIPTLVFDEQSLCFRPYPKAFLSNKFVNFVDRVLLHHKGSIQKFELSTHSLTGYVIDSWIIFLSKNGVKELVFQFMSTDQYVVHSSFFSCEAICLLYLSDCIIKPPPMFKGFSYLKSLNLVSVTIASEVLESLVSSCTNLETLGLMYLNGCSCIKIYGPNLKRFHLYGEFVDVCFIDAPHLSFVSITLYDAVVKHFGQGEVSNLARVLGCLTALEKLVICDFFMEFLAMGNLPKRLPVVYDRLKTILLHINFQDLNQCLAIICLFQSSPNLQKLDLKADVDDAMEYVEDFWKAQRRLNCSMNHLRVVKIRMFGTQPELEFIEFLLANSPVLEELSVDHVYVNKVKDSRVLKELVRFRRASAKAEINYN